jgi:hypothetical protein
MRMNMWTSRMNIQCINEALESLGSIDHYPADPSLREALLKTLKTEAALLEQSMTTSTLSSTPHGRVLIFYKDRKKVKGGSNSSV